MRPVKQFLLAATAVVPLISDAAQAQAPREGGGGGSETQRIVQQYQQLAAEKTSLQSQVDSLKHDLDAAHTELASVKKERDAFKAHASAATGANIAELKAAQQAAEKSAEQSKDRINELVSRFRDTANQLKVIETDRDQLKGQLAERNTAYDQCAADNLSLYELNGQVLDGYEHVGLFTRISSSDPITRIARNRNENLVDHYRARAQELREKASASGQEGSAGKRAPGP